MGGEANTWAEKRTCGRRSEHVGGEANTWAEKRTRGRRSEHVGVHVGTRIDLTMDVLWCQVKQAGIEEKNFVV